VLSSLFNLSKGHLSVIDPLYTVKLTSNKINLVYRNNQLIGTASYITNSEKELINK
jgi:hypothetical protein